MGATMTPTPCIPSSSGFVWRITSDQRIEFTHDYQADDPDSSRWFSCGAAADPDGAFAHVFDKSFQATPLTWRTVIGYEDSTVREWFRNKQKHAWVEGTIHTPLDSDSFILRLRMRDEDRSLRLLSLVGHSIGFKLDAQSWRMLSPNAVLHPHFGPAVTVATDGQRVVLFSFPRFGSEYTITHREAIMGPISTTPVPTAAWDYYRNSSSATQANAVSKSEKKVAAQKHDKDAATALLQQLNQTLGLNIKID